MFEKEVSKDVRRCLIVCFVIEFLLMVLKGIKPFSMYDIILDITRYLEVVLCSLSYIFTLVNEKREKGKVHIISVILSICVIAWLFLRAYTTSVYLMLLGQCILYIYLLWTDYSSKRKLNLKLVTVIILSASIGYVDASASSKVVKVFDIIVSVIVLLVFADPYLGRLADISRENRGVSDTDSDFSKLPLKKKLLALLVGRRNIK